MLDRCKQLHISLNLKKCIFCTPFGTLLGHVVCKEGLFIDQEKIATILDMIEPTFLRELHATLEYTWYYRRFIRNSAKVVAPLENLLCKDTNYIWNPECQEALETLKEKLVTTPILIFPYRDKIFYVHVDASSISLGTMFMQLVENNIDHPVYFSSRNLSYSEKNYMTMECEGMAMVYALKKFRHYLLDMPFKFFTDHSTLKYLVNKPVLGGEYADGFYYFKNLTLNQS
jgi:hypothetical protein